MRKSGASDLEPMTWVILVRVTASMSVGLWCLGFVASLFFGGDADLALSKATVATLSSLVGLLAYLGITRPLRRPETAYQVTGLGWIFMGSPNVLMLLSTEGPWSFPEMLVRSVVLSAVTMTITALFCMMSMQRVVKPAHGNQSEPTPTPGPSPEE